MKEIYGIRKLPDGRDFWDKIGIARENRDGSLNLIFDYFPTMRDTRIQVREKKVWDEEERI